MCKLAARVSNASRGYSPAWRQPLLDGIRQRVPSTLELALFAMIPAISGWDDDLVEIIAHVLDLQVGDCVLDLACGSGYHARRPAARGANVRRVDISYRLIAHCRERSIE